ncbi:dermonecrotic toxin domain-containing protein [Pandoraea pneumonica]|uniref:dermonecrotic toxin domain-containing protein n=1 Tax=Pandoraea pneumonica TaxID=2508299 RepID=UPI003CF1FE1F
MTTPREDTATPCHRQVLAQIERFDTLSDAACAALDEPPEAALALGLLLRLAEEGIPAHDLMALDEPVIEQVTQLHAEHPALVKFWLAGLPSRLANRKPWQSVQDVCHASLTRQALRDLERSIGRRDVDVSEGADYGTRWRSYFTHWRAQIVDTMRHLMLLGSGHEWQPPARDALTARGIDTDATADVNADANANINANVHALAAVAERSHSPTSPTFQPYAPLPDFTRAGKAGYLIALLYGLAVVNRPEPVHGTARLPRDPDPSVFAHLAQITADGWDAFLETTAGVNALAQQLLDTPLPFDPLRMPVAGAQLPPGAQSRAFILGPAPLPPHRQREFNATSPALQRLFDIANLWRHRAALHHEQQMSSGPALLFTPPPSETHLLLNLLDRASELAGLDVDALVLRRVSPSAPDSRVNLVHYWTLRQAAQLMRSGKLDILQPDSDTSFSVSEKTPAGAIVMPPSVMSATAFAELVTTWRTQCEARNRQTWQPHESFAALVNSTDTVSLQRDMALSDLTIAYEAGWLSHRAMRLGRSGLLPTNAVASKPAAVNVYPLRFSFPRDGITIVAPPAGTFVLCEQPRSGMTLLFMMGEPVAWREFSSPQALVHAVEKNIEGVRDSLHTRLPHAFLAASAQHTLSVGLDSRAAVAPLTVAANATVAVINAELPLLAAQSQTSGRIAQYRRWIDGASTGDLERDVTQARANAKARVHPTFTHGLTWTASDISHIEHYQTLRGDLSFALPEPREIARQYVISTMSANRVTGVDPDELFVRFDRSLRPIRLPDALIYRAARPTAEPVGSLLRMRDAESMEPWRPGNSRENRALDADELVDQRSATAYLAQVSNAFDTLWREHFDDIRQSLKGEFIAQCWLGNASQALSCEVMEIAQRMAGPIELSRLNRTVLRQKIPTPDVQREWLKIQGHPTSLMAVSIAGRPAVLLLAGYADGLHVDGFKDRSALTAWFDTQTRSTEGRERLASATSVASTMPSGNDWLRYASIDGQGEPIPTGTGTFTALTQAYKTRLSRGFERIDNPHTMLVNVMRYLSQLDLLVGMGTWLAPELRPFSATMAMIDAGFGVVGVSVGGATGDAALLRQGWQSLAAAIGGQGLATVRFKARALITRDPRFLFFVDEAPNAREALIPGLYRTQQRLYAAVDSNTRTYLSFDEPTGFFRAVRGPDSIRSPEAGPLMRLSPGGRWHTVSPDDLPTAPLEDPHIGWHVDQRFRARYDLLRARRNPVFEEARRASANAGAAQAAQNTAASRSSLRLLKLEFLDRSIRDPAQLGALAGRIETAQNAVDATEAVGLSPMRQQAEAAGAQYLQLAQRPHTYLGHVRRGLARVTALNARTGPIELMPAWFNEIATLPPAASASFMEDLSLAGTIPESLIFTETRSVPLANLEGIFDDMQGPYRVFEMRAGTRTVLIGRRPHSEQANVYFFLDPNVAFVSTTQRNQLISMARAHLEAMSGEYAIARQNGASIVTLSEVDVQRLADASIVRDFEEVIPMHQAFGI